MYLQAGGFSQRDQRRPGTIFIDQHGREYHATIELKTGHPTGPLEPLFQAPLMPPMNYIRVGMDRRRPYDVKVDYDAWLADLRTGWDEWKNRGDKLARLVHGEKYVAGAPFTRQIIEELGPSPQHVEPVLAAKQGNAYVLGQTTKVDVRLFALLQEDVQTRTVVTEPDFSQVVESLDDDTLDELEPIQNDADTELARRRKADRERKAAARTAARAAAKEARLAARNAGPIPA